MKSDAMCSEPDGADPSLVFTTLARHRLDHPTFAKERTCVHAHVLARDDVIMPVIDCEKNS
jgi:hypothetical protein